MSGLGGIFNEILGGGNVETGQQAPQIDPTATNAALSGMTQGPNVGRQQGAMDLMQQMAAGQGPSAATALLQQQANRAQAQTSALASSGTGAAGQGLARRQAMMQGAQLQQGLGDQASVARATEQMGAIGQLGQQTTAARGQDIQAGLGAAGIQAGLATSQANLQEQTQQLQEQAQEANQKAGGDMFKNVAGMVAGAAMFSSPDAKTDIRQADTGAADKEAYAPHTGQDKMSTLSSPPDAKTGVMPADPQSLTRGKHSSLYKASSLESFNRPTPDYDYKMPVKAGQVRDVAARWSKGEMTPDAPQKPTETDKQLDAVSKEVASRPQTDIDASGHPIDKRFAGLKVSELPDHVRLAIYEHELSKDPPTAAPAAPKDLALETAKEEVAKDPGQPPEQLAPGQVSPHGVGPKNTNPANKLTPEQLKTWNQDEGTPGNAVAGALMGLSGASPYEMYKMKLAQKGQPQGGTPKGPTSAKFDYLNNQLSSPPEAKEDIKGADLPVDMGDDSGRQVVAPGFSMQGEKNKLFYVPPVYKDQLLGPQHLPPESAYKAREGTEFVLPYQWEYEVQKKNPYGSLARPIERVSEQTVTAGEPSLQGRPAYVPPSPSRDSRKEAEGRGDEIVSGPAAHKDISDIIESKQWAKKHGLKESLPEGATEIDKEGKPIDKGLLGKFVEFLKSSPESKKEIFSEEAGQTLDKFSKSGAKDVELNVFKKKGPGYEKLEAHKHKMSKEEKEGETEMGSGGGGNGGGQDNVEDALRNLNPYSYKYKLPQNEPIPNPKGGERFFGVMTTDLKKHPVTRNMVSGAGADEKVAIPAATSFSLASVAHLQKKVDALEKMMGSKRGKRG